jgi:hypothetical protein
MTLIKIKTTNIKKSDLDIGENVKGNIKYDADIKTLLAKIKAAKEKQ